MKYTIGGIRGFHYFFNNHKGEAVNAQAALELINNGPSTCEQLLGEKIDGLPIPLNRTEANKMIQYGFAYMFEHCPMEAQKVLEQLEIDNAETVFLNCAKQMQASISP